MTQAAPPPGPTAGPPLSPQPDDKDWTWVLSRPCPECGFSPDVDREALADALRREGRSWTAVLERDDVRDRPQPATWSALEYGAHVRDVLRLCVLRTRLMLDEDDPEFADWDQDATALEDRYDLHDPATVARDVVAQGERAGGLFAGLSDEQWARPGRRSNGSRFTVESFGRYVLHDLVHHRQDVAG